MVVKILVGCSQGSKSWFFEENDTVEGIIEKVILEFKYPEHGLYELWQSYKTYSDEGQSVLNNKKKIKDIKLKEGEMLHFIDLTFTITPEEKKKKKKD